MLPFTLFQYPGARRENSTVTNTIPQNRLECLFRQVLRFACKLSLNI